MLFIVLIATLIAFFYSFYLVYSLWRYVGWSLFLSAGFSYLVMHLIGNRWWFYDVGINAGANSFTLLFFVFPVAFLSLVFTSNLVDWLLTRRAKRQGSERIKAMLITMTVVTLTLFFLDLISLRDYPNPFNATVGKFWVWYFTGTDLRSPGY